MNSVHIVNETHVIRFDILNYEGISRYKGEQIAYERLHNTGVPVPTVLVFDNSKTHAPYTFIIMTKLEGVPLAHVWNNLSTEQQIQVAYDAGRYLAMIHDVSFEGFGTLQTLRFTKWFERVIAQVESDTTEATYLRQLDASVAERIRNTFDEHHSMLDIGKQGKLLHGDFQFKNILYHQGRITGIIDFEWANAGDPCWDFRLEETWEADCVGSRRYIYDGYASYRPIDDDQMLRVRLYKMLQYVNEVIFYSQDQPNPKELQRYLKRLNALCATF